jgi:hypothetical protein
MVSPWDLRLGETPVPVHIWPGTEDNFGAPPMAEYVHRAIPGSQLTTHPEGHLSIMSNHVEEVVGTLMADRR